MNDYILIKKFISSEFIIELLKLAHMKNESESKIGNRVCKENKIRKDVFFTKTESKYLDEKVFFKIKDIVNENFKIQLNYRETYKLAKYYGEEKGFYIPHTDTQGGPVHRQISLVICLSNSNDYEGGVFKFVNLQKNFKFDLGDAIIFKSHILHGVEPVISGKRQTLISFMWDEDNETIRTNDITNKNYVNYLSSTNLLDLNKSENTIYQFSLFDNYHPKIISYSLWGDSEIYNYGIIENALVAKELLPDFKIYVYFNNTVLIKTFNILKKMDNVILILVDDNKKCASNTFWRYCPCFKSDSIIFIRDTDSLINERDLFVINDFINSRFDICSAKDNPAHYKYAIVAGAWGCKNGILKKYLSYYNNYPKTKLDVRGIDQDFLIQIYYENISKIQLYIPELCDPNQFYENNIKYITQKSNHIGSYNYFCPKTCSLLVEDNRKLTVKRYYSFGVQSYRNAFKTITLIPADSGPGNQIIGIKECLILSELLNRICIIPPIREHYLSSNNIFYNFNEIFNLDLPNIIIDNNTYSILNNITLEKKTKYVIHGNYLNKKLRHESIINNDGYDEILLNKKNLNKENSIDELKNIKDNLIIIKHLFNNVYISECGINGCFTCKINSEFKNLYERICSNWDFSDNIKKIGNKYIEINFRNQDFISLHIRLPDIMCGEIDKYTNNVYTNKKLIDIISKLKTENNKPIFICSNNISYFKNLGLNFNFINFPHKYLSFIDQYICCKSEIFYFLNLENTRFGHKHNRSTYTSFILDYRLYRDHKNNNSNINLYEI